MWLMVEDAGVEELAFLGRPGSDAEMFRLYATVSFGSMATSIIESLWSYTR